MIDIMPRYLELFACGELQRRTQSLYTRLVCCDICPRNCGVNRLAEETGFCRSGPNPIIASVCAHHGEEPPLSGTRGSGTIFFGSCNLRCVYCQNYQISQDSHAENKSSDVYELARNMLYIQNDLKCHNINLVSPSHFVPQILRALILAIPEGLNLPLIYNTGGYDSLETVRELDGIIDIYLPDIRYSDNSLARKYSRCRDYVQHNRQVIKEMRRQAGNMILDEDGIARRGLIVRHLILPNQAAGSVDSLKWLAEEVSPDITLSLMAQYYPAHLAPRIPALSRHINHEEYQEVRELLEVLGIENGWIQEMTAADHYRPDFGREGHPFNS